LNVCLFRNCWLYSTCLQPHRLVYRLWIFKTLFCECWSKQQIIRKKLTIFFCHVKQLKQILRIGQYEFLGVQSEVNFAADRINLDDNLKTSWNKILSSITILCLSYLEKYEASSTFFDARFFETFISRFHPTFPDGIWYFPCIKLYKQIRQIHSSCFQTLLEEKAERILFT